MLFQALSLIIVTSASLISQAQNKYPTYYCESLQPRGAVYLQLDTKNKKSIARISNPFTQDLKSLKQKNPDSSQYTKLFIDHVALEKSASGRPLCADCYSFNASVYPMAQIPAVIEGTKSRLTQVRLEGTQAVVVQLQYFVDVDQMLTLNCEKLN